MSAKTELKLVDDSRDTLPKIDTVPPLCPALEGAIIKLGALEATVVRLDSNLSIANETLRRLTVAIEELTNALRR